MNYPTFEYRGSKVYIEEFVSSRLYGYARKYRFMFGNIDSETVFTSRFEAESAARLYIDYILETDGPIDDDDESEEKK